MRGHAAVGFGAAAGLDALPCFLLGLEHCAGADIDAGHALFLCVPIARNEVRRIAAPPGGGVEAVGGGERVERRVGLHGVVLVDHGGVEAAHQQFSLAGVRRNQDHAVDHWHLGFGQAGRAAAWRAGDALVGGGLRLLVVEGIQPRAAGVA
ncbi:hypothetical protein D3C72_1670720 [compost metagenome]